MKNFIATPTSTESSAEREAHLRAGSFFGTLGVIPRLNVKIDLDPRRSPNSNSFGGLNFQVKYVFRANTADLKGSRLFDQTKMAPLSPLADTLLSDVFLPEKDGQVFEGKDVLEWWIDAPADQAPESCSLLKD